MYFKAFRIVIFKSRKRRKLTINNKALEIFYIKKI